MGHATLMVRPSLLFLHIAHWLHAHLSHPVCMLQFAGEQAVREIYPEATIFKPGQLIGVEDNLMNNLARLAKKFPIIPLIDGGHQKIQPVYVRDVAQAMINSLKTKECLGQDYYLGGPDVIS